MNALPVLLTILILVLFAGTIVGIVFLQRFRWGIPDENGKKKKKIKFSLIMLIGLGLGTFWGFLLKLLFSADVAWAWAVNESLDWIEIIEVLFLNSLKFVVIPLVFVSIVRSLLKLGAGRETTKNAFRIIGVLLVTVAASAAFGVFFAWLFKFDISQIKLKSLAGNKPTTLIDTIKSIVPENVFAALASNTALPVVFAAIAVGMAVVAVKKYAPDLGKKIVTAFDAAYEIIGTIVDYVIKVTPYGILGLVTVQIATNDFSVFATLGKYIGAFYAGIVCIAAMHILLLVAFKIDLKTFFKKSAPAYLLAFSANSSIAALPLTIKSLNDMKVSDGTANLAGTFGTCMGQNACAGLYPAMLAMVVATHSSLGINPFTFSFAITVILFAAIGSIGIAGVDGGNIQASLLLLSMLGLPYQWITLFLSIDFILGFARPPMNMSGSLVAGVLAQKMADNAFVRKNKRRAKQGLPPLTEEVFVGEDGFAGENI